MTDWPVKLTRQFIGDDPLLRDRVTGPADSTQTPSASPRPAIEQPGLAQQPS